MCEELKPCPFCNSEKLDHSFKIATKQHRGPSMYHGTVYCKACHAYGPRVLCYTDNMYRYSADDEATWKQQASLAWNGSR